MQARRVVLGLVALLTVALLAACSGAPVESGSDAAAGSDAASGDAASGAVELQLMGWASSEAENDRLQSVVDNINEAQDGFTLTMNLVPDYDTKLQTSMAGGAPPDVFYIDSFKFPDLVASGSVIPVQNIENPDDFYPNLREAFSSDGEFYCPPKDFSTLGLIYNTDMFDAAGLEYPTTDWTWDDLHAAAEALTDAENGVVGLALSPDMARWLAFLYQAGGSVVNDDFTAMTINSPEAQEALAFYVGLVQDGFAAQPADLSAGWNGEAFGQGAAAMTIEGNWIMPFMTDQFPDINFAVAELPAGPAGKATLSFTVCYDIPANGKNSEAASQAVNLLTNETGMAAWTDLGLAMPTRASLRDGWLEQYPDQEAFLNGAEYAYPWQFRPGFSDVLDTFNSGLQEAMAGTKSVDAVLSDTETVGTEVLNR
ncbi:MAG: ABC transporter substrate-binding protein [Caldilineaceae bacterium]|nr:ABC transporter substrate-binding protein [Caldilineaceae bacterium]